MAASHVDITKLFGAFFIFPFRVVDRNVSLSDCVVFFGTVIKVGMYDAGLLFKTYFFAPVARDIVCRRNIEEKISVKNG